MQFSQFDTDWVLDGVFRADSQYPKTWPDESERVALASATRFCGAELRSPKSRKTPAPVPGADALPVLCMHGINKKGLHAKTGKPFYLISGGDGGNRTYRKLRFLRHLEGFAGKMQTINPQRQLSAKSGH